jgi:hypothetical protein
MADAKVVSRSDDTEEDYVNAHSLGEVLRFANLSAGSVFGGSLLDTDREMRIHSDTGRSYLAVTVDVELPSEEYLPKRKAFLSSIWERFPELDPEFVLFSVRRRASSDRIR